MRGGGLVASAQARRGSALSRGRGRRDGQWRLRGCSAETQGGWYLIGSLASYVWGNDGMPIGSHRRGRRDTSQVSAQRLLGIFVWWVNEAMICVAQQLELDSL